MPSDAPHSRSGSSGGTAGPSCTEAPGEFARSLQEALATAKRDVSGVTAAQLRLGCAVLCTLAFGLGVWGASRSIVVASSWAAGLAGELAGSADNVLAYLVLFTYFQLVPALQEKVMLYGTPVAVTVRLLLCSAAAKGSAVLIALRATAAPLLLLLGWQSFASSSRPLRIFGCAGADALRALSRLPLWCASPAGLAGMDADRRGNLRDLPDEAARLVARLPQGWCLTPLAGVLVAVELVDALLASGSLDSSHTKVAAGAHPAQPLLMTTAVFALLASRALYLTVALPVADRPHLHMERPAGVAMCFLGVAELMQLVFRITITAPARLACVGIIMVFGICLSSEEKTFADDASPAFTPASRAASASWAGQRENSPEAGTDSILCSDVARIEMTQLC
mmetsp:Transcript_41638/g.98721  ORF Transcript_41638/g.98721 Transcript_41638/m.98721 type:complete len:395 (-) Transcript_41638:106-1290(-)